MRRQKYPGPSKRAAVLHQRFRAVANRLLEPIAGRERQQTVAVKIDRKSLRRSQRNPPKIGRDHPLIAHMRSNEGRKSRIPDADRPVVDDRGAGPSTPLEAQNVRTRHEPRRIQIMDRRDKPARVDAGIRPEHDPVPVHENNRAIGLQRPENRGRVPARHPVGRHGRRRRLHEAGGLSRPDRKAPPVNHRTVRSLRHSHDSTVRPDRSRTRNDVSIERIARYGLDKTARQDSSENECAQAAAQSARSEKAACSRQAARAGNAKARPVITFRKTILHRRLLSPSGTLHCRARSA